MSTLIATSTAEPAKLIGEIQPETLLEPNGQVRYNNANLRFSDKVIPLKSTREASLMCAG